MSADSSSLGSRVLKSLGVVLGSLSIFFLAQVVSVFLIAIILGSVGWSPERVSDWLVDSTEGQFVAVLLIEAATIVGVWLVINNVHKRTLSSALNLKKRFSRLDIMAVVAGFAAYFSISFITRIFVELLIPAVNLDQSQQIGFDNVAGAPLVLVFFALCVAVPIGEEVLFRGLLFGSLKKYAGLRPAWVITSLIFGAAHLEFLNDGPLNWSAALDTAVFSGVLIWAYQRRGNLWVPIGLHALKNTIAFLYLFVF